MAPACPPRAPRPVNGPCPSGEEVVTAPVRSRGGPAGRDLAAPRGAHRPRARVPALRDDRAHAARALPACGVRYDAPAARRGARAADRRARRRRRPARRPRRRGRPGVRSKHARERRDAAATRVAVAREKARLIRLQAPHRGGAPGLRRRRGRDRRRAPARAARPRRRRPGRDHRRRAPARRHRRARGADRPHGLRPRPPRPGRGPRRHRAEQARRPVRLHRHPAAHRGHRRPGGRRLRLPLRHGAELHALHLDVLPQHARRRASAAVALAQVRLDRACLAATGRVRGTGYEDTGPRP